MDEDTVLEAEFDNVMAEIAEEKREAAADERKKKAKL